MAINSPVEVGDRVMCQERPQPHFGKVTLIVSDGVLDTITVRWETGATTDENINSLVLVPGPETS